MEKHFKIMLTSDENLVNSGVLCAGEKMLDSQVPQLALQSLAFHIFHKKIYFLK